MPPQTQPEETQPNSNPTSEKPVLHNRVQTLMIHTTRYAFQGQARLAHDAGVSRSTISRLLAGKTMPSLRLAQAVTNALARSLSRPLDTADLFSRTAHIVRRPAALYADVTDACRRLRMIAGAPAGRSGRTPGPETGHAPRRLPQFRSSRHRLSPPDPSRFFSLNLISR